GACLPGADRVELHGHLVASLCFIKGEQVATMAKHADETAVAKRAWVFAGLHQRRVDWDRAHQAAIERATGAALDAETARPDEPVAVAGAAVVEIDRVDHTVAVHRV